MFKAVTVEDLPAGADPKDALKSHVASINKNTKWDTILPIMNTALEINIQPSLGDDFYEELKAAYDAYPTSGLNAEQVKLIRALQRSVAYFTYFHTIQELQLTVADRGPGEVSSSDGSFSGVRQWVQVGNLKASWNKANFFLDKALSILDSLADTFTTWRDSDLGKKSVELFINSAGELEQYLPLYAGRVVYQVLRPYVVNAEIKMIKPLLGDDFFKELKDAISSRNLTDVQNELIDKIRRALSIWVLRNAVPMLRLKYEEGLVSPAFDSGIKKGDPASNEVVTSLYIKLGEEGDFFLQEVKNWLDQNASSFPTYQNSDKFGTSSPAESFLQDEDDYEQYRRSFITFF